MNKNWRELGCTSSSCSITGKSKGIHTNGGCHCLEGLSPEQRRKVRWALQSMREEILGKSSETEDATEFQTALRAIVSAWDSLTGDRKWLIVDSMAPAIKQAREVLSDKTQRIEKYGNDTRTI